MAGIEKLEQDPLNYVLDTFYATKQWRDSYEDLWTTYYQLYRSYRDKTLTPFKSNIFVPYIFSIVESVVPKMLGTLFNTRPLITVMPRKGASENLAKLLERLLEYQMDEDQLELFSKVLEFFKEAAIYGTSFAKIVPKFNNDDLATFNFIDIEPIDLFNIYPDFRARSINRMKYIIQLSYVEYDDLEAQYNAGFYKDVPELLGCLEGIMTVDDAKRDRLSEVDILDEYGFDSRRRIVEVLEYWDRDHIVTIGGRQRVIKNEENPVGRILPFIMTRYVPVQHELYGIGIPEIGKSLQDELNTVRNQRADNVNIIINRMFVANKYADIDMDSLVSYPGNVIMTNDVNSIVPLETRDITKSAYMEEEIIKRDIDNATGEWEYSRGATPPRRETATGIIRLQQASNIRFDTVVKLLEFTVIRSIAKTFLWLDYQFLPRDDFIKIVGEEEYMNLGGDVFYQQPIDEVLKQYHFQPMGSSTTAIKEVRIQQIMQAFQMFNQDPYIDQMELRKLVLDTLDIKNINRLLRPPQPMGIPVGDEGGPPLPGAEGGPEGGEPGQPTQEDLAAMMAQMGEQGGQQKVQNPTDIMAQSLGQATQSAANPSGAQPAVNRAAAMK